MATKRKRAQPTPFAELRVRIPKSMGEQDRDWLASYPPAVVAAAQRLVSDERMKPLWSDGFTSAHLQLAASEFDVATNRDSWTNTTSAARELWLESFQGAVDRLLELAHQGPRKPREWGFPVRDTVLAELARRFGASVPDQLDPAFWTRVGELERLADSIDWNIEDSLRHYASTARMDASGPQVLKKPGDPKAARAQFIIYFATCGLSAAKVATVASVMFEDDVDDRAVRKLISPRR